MQYRAGINVTLRFACLRFISHRCQVNTGSLAKYH